MNGVEFGRWLHFRYDTGHHIKGSPQGGYDFQPKSLILTGV